MLTRRCAVWYNAHTKSRRRVCCEYYITKKGEEVDFFVTDKVTKEMRLVQVSYEMPKGQTREREISALRNARSETGIRNCEIVTWDEEGEEDGIRIVPAWKWLIAK
jgi:predicted AAA+ superfamily ATPase